MSFKNIISDFMKLVCSKHDKNIKKKKCHTKIKFVIL